MGTFAFLFLAFAIFYPTEAIDVLKAIWDESYPLSMSVRSGLTSPRAQTEIIGHLSRLPFTDIVKFDVWNKLSKDENFEEFYVEDWKDYETLIPYLPLTYLEKVNLTDEELISYFGSVQLSKFHLMKLAEEISARNTDILKRDDKILKLGNIICGFPASEVSTIKDSTIRYLIKNNFFHKVNFCEVDQLKSLFKLVIKYTVAGPSRTWEPDLVKAAGHLISAMSAEEIRDIPIKSFSEITPKVIEAAPIELLKSISDSQLEALSRPSLLAWRRRTLDMRYLYRNSACSQSLLYLLLLLPTVSYGLTEKSTL